MADKKIVVPYMRSAKFESSVIGGVRLFHGSPAHNAYLRMRAEQYAKSMEGFEERAKVTAALTPYDRALKKRTYELKRYARALKERNPQEAADIEASIAAIKREHVCDHVGCCTRQ